MKKCFTLIVAILSTCLLMLSACVLNNHNNENDIEFPIDKITLNIDSQAITLDSTRQISADISPSYSDDSIVWSSSNNKIINVDNGNITAVGLGEAIVYAQAKHGNVRSSVTLRVIPESDSDYINKCSKIANKAILTIKNYCYNSFLGITTSSKTITFNAVIFNKTSTSYFFMSAYKGFEKVDGYDYQTWTAIDCNGNEYPIRNIQYEDDKTLGYNYQLAIGSISAYDLDVLQISSRGSYFNNEYFYVKDGSTFIKSYKYNTSSSSPTDINLSYKDSMLGAPVLDSSYNFVGLIIGENTFPLNGNTNFVTTFKMKDFAESCGISI